MTTATRGRPREFDTELALDAALEVFWRQGYEGTSLTDLTAAMGINKPSLYAAFGSKRELFRAVLARYAVTDLAYARTALEEPTARAVIATYLRANVVAVTREERPRGCFSVQSGLTSSPENADISTMLATARGLGEAGLRDRLAVAARAGELVDVSPAPLARYVMTVSEGLAVHAAAGSSREELTEVVDVVLAGLPVSC